MRQDEIMRNAMHVVEGLVTDRHEVHMAKEAEAFIQLLDDQELLGWIRGITEAVHARAAEWRTTPPAGPWANGLGHGYSSDDNEGSYAGITLIVHGRPGDVGVKAPDSAPQSFVDAVCAASSTLGLSNLTIDLVDWTTSAVIADNVILEAAEDALDDALATPAERQGRWLRHALGTFNAQLVKNPDISARFNRVFQANHKG